MGRFDLTDFEWSVIEPLLPTKVRGVKRRDDRQVLNGIFWRLRTGAPWADIPARCRSLMNVSSMSATMPRMVITIRPMLPAVVTSGSSTRNEAPFWSSS